MTSENRQELLTVREVAERNRLSIDTVKRALRNKRLVGRKVGSRGDWRIPVEQYHLWVEEGAPVSPVKALGEPADEAANEPQKE